MKVKATCLCHEDEHEFEINPASLLAKSAKRTRGKDGRFKKEEQKPY